MKPLNVFIFPADDRSGQASAIYNYTRLGHNVFVPKHGTMGLHWKTAATWPSLLFKATENPTKRNLEVHGFERSDDQLFGEDYFLKTFEAPLYDEPYTCQIIDPDSPDCPVMDVYHTFRGGENYLPHYMSEAKRRWPNVKWISSTINAWNFHPSNMEPPNRAPFLPANYESAFPGTNVVPFFCHEFERKLLATGPEHSQKLDFASMNHNFKVRQPQDFQLFQEMNEILVKAGYSPIQNFGGNVRAQGADIRFSGKNGQTGHLQTLSPRQSLSTIEGLKALVHFKTTDWGGGVFYYAMNTHTPIITTQRYIDMSNSGKFLIHGFNCLVVNNPMDAASAVALLSTNDQLVKQLSSGMEQIKNAVFSPEYWTRWENFLEGLL